MHRLCLSLFFLSSIAALVVSATLNHGEKYAAPSTLPATKDPPNTPIWCIPGPLKIINTALNRHLINGKLENGLDVTVYKSNQAFCATMFTGGYIQSNMGGFCYKYNQQLKTSVLAFSPYLGDSVLRTRSSYCDYCRGVCRCFDEAFDKGYTSRLPESNDEYDVAQRPALSEPHPEAQPFSSGDQMGKSDSLPSSADSSPPTQNKQTDFQCRANTHCGDRFCSWTGVEGCRCLAERTTAAGQFKIIGCGLLSSVLTSGKTAIGIGGRSEDSPKTPLGNAAAGIACPCNQSYVSLSCCEAESGIIWEPQELRLGWIATGSQIT